MTLPWRIPWSTTAVAGATALILGVIQWTFSHTDCGSNYEYGWVAFGTLLLALPAGAVLVAGSDRSNGDTASRQRTYAVGALIALAIVVIAWQARVIDVPGIQNHDVPFFGDSLGCGL